MSLTNSAETSILNLIFKNTAWANIGNAGGLLPSSAAGSFYISLHTADPGEAGSQNTSEVAYTGYARVAVTRGSGFNVSGNDATNAAAVQFPLCTGGSATATHFGVGTDVSGTGNLIVKGALNSSLAISNGIQPQFSAGELHVTAD